MKQLTHLSLFSGIGGLDLAAEWAGFQTVGQCEFADYPTKVLEKHWPDVPRWRDIQTLTKESFYERTGLRTVDIISGGFPCQPFSVAGNQKGKEDERYLWPEMLRVIRKLAPGWVVGENVPGILRIAGRTVCEDLEREGYAVAIFNFEAAAVGAPHRRDRVFFVANRDGDCCDTWRSESERQQWQTGFANGGGALENACHDRCEQPGILQEQSGRAESIRASQGSAGWTSADVPTDVADAKSPECAGRRGEARGWRSESGCGGRWLLKPGLGGLADGLPAGLDGHFDIEPDIPRVMPLPKRKKDREKRVNRLKGDGNAVVPQQAYPIFRAIAEIEQWAAPAKEAP